MDEDIWSRNRLFQRRTSLTFPKPLGTRDSFQNRSLQDFSDRIKLTAGDELEFRRRRQSIFCPGGLEKAVSPPQSSESLNSDTLKDEWKQVTNNNPTAFVCKNLSLICFGYHCVSKDSCSFKRLEKIPKLKENE